MDLKFISWDHGDEKDTTVVALYIASKGIGGDIVITLLETKTIRGTPSLPSGMAHWTEPTLAKVKIL